MNVSVATESPVPAKTPWWSSHWLVGLVAFGLACAGFISRRPDQWFGPQFWAEDGKIFFRDAAMLGWNSWLKSYAGYLHAVPRTIACLVRTQPWEALPRIYVIAALLAAALVVTRVTLARLPVGVRILAAVALIAVPHSGEVFLNVTNLQWILDLLLLVNLLEKAPERTGEMIRRTVELLLAGFSGLMAILLAPLAATWCWRNRKLKKAWPLILAWVAVIVVQALLLHASERPIRQDAGDVFSSLHWVMPRYATVLAVGTRLPYSIELGRLIVTGGLLATCVLLVDRSNENRFVSLMLMATAVGILMLSRLGGPHWPNPMGANARYTYVPFVMVMWAFVILANGTRRRPHQILALSLYAAAVFASVSTWKAAPLPDGNWPQQVREARGGSRMQFEVAPGLSFPVPFPIPAGPTIAP